MVQSLEEYLEVYSNFLLGDLTTEGFHPLTNNLSELANNQLDLAFNILKEVDILALKVLEKKIFELIKLKEKIAATLSDNNKIFLCGCGATGRLSIVLESIFRQTHSNTQYGNRIISFMAGGDVALIKAIESFEDRTDFGQKQLMDLGFSEGDLLIASTEGGETSFVIGATQQAALISPGNSVFVYCNENDELMGIDRSRQVIDNMDVIKLCLACGPMALSGSTRMQATSVMMLAVGLALVYFDKQDSYIKNKLNKVQNLLKDFDYSLMSSLTEKESYLYKNNQFITYQTSPDIGLSVLTDTTERSPTFSLDPFENFHLDQHMALCYLSIKGVYDAEEAWRFILKRSPRCLEWGSINGVATKERLFGFDISENAIIKRNKKKHQYVFSIEYNKDELLFDLDGVSTLIDVNGLDRLEVHLLLKLLLNAHSTLLMGRMNRYMDNMMTWVKASNLKLVDRAIRYVQKLLKNRGIHADYEIVAARLFSKLNSVNSSRPIVIATFESFLN